MLLLLFFIGTETVYQPFSRNSRKLEIRKESDLWDSRRRYFSTLNHDGERTKDSLNCSFMRTVLVINTEVSLMSIKEKERKEK